MKQAGAGSAARQLQLAAPPVPIGNLLLGTMKSPKRRPSGGAAAAALASALAVVAALRYALAAASTIADWSASRCFCDCLHLQPAWLSGSEGGSAGCCAAGSAPGSASVPASADMAAGHIEADQAPRLPGTARAEQAARWAFGWCRIPNTPALGRGVAASHLAWAFASSPERLGGS